MKSGKCLRLTCCTSEILLDFIVFIYACTHIFTQASSPFRRGTTRGIGLRIFGYTGLAAASTKWLAELAMDVTDVSSKKYVKHEDPKEMVLMENHLPPPWI